MSDRETLLSFGFTEAKVDRALKATKNAGLQPCLDWLEKHADDADDASMDVDEPAAAGAGASGSGENAEDDEAKLKGLENAGEAKSLVCDQCGKRFRNTALAEFHAEKSGHDQFSESTEEIKPLTEEEKAAKLAELKAAMAAKRAARAEAEKAEAKENERLRRKSGKEMAEIKAEAKLKEIEKEAAQRKRDKLDEARAKARVKEQIEADKRARAEKAAKDKAIRDGKPLPTAAADAGPSTASTAKVSAGSSASVNTRLQLRLPEGTPVTTTMPSSSKLADVATFLREQHGWSGSLSFSTTFPRRKFEPTEMVKSLQELGLSPSSVLVVQP